MKKRRDKPDNMREDYDFSQLRLKGRGLYADRYREGHNVRLLSPDPAQEFRDDEAVNKALREYLKLKKESA